MDNDAKEKYCLADRGLENLTEYLQHITPMIENAATNFRVKDETESNKYYIECIDALKLLSELIEGIKKLLGLDFSDIMLDQENLEDKIGKLSKIIESMHQAQNIKDWVTLADLLEYELAPVLKEWICFLPGLRDEIKRK